MRCVRVEWQGIQWVGRSPCDLCLLVRRAMRVKHVSELTQEIGLWYKVLISTICVGAADLKTSTIQVGASNELPESEELDALYDRFLIRRRVGQVSLAGLPGLLSGNRQQLFSISAESNGAGAVNQHEGGLAFSEEEMEDIRWELPSQLNPEYSCAVAFGQTYCVACLIPVVRELHNVKRCVVHLQAGSIEGQGHRGHHQPLVRCTDISSGQV